VKISTKVWRSQRVLRTPNACVKLKSFFVFLRKAEMDAMEVATEFCDGWGGFQMGMGIV
jgi:hypothetical protein